MDTGKNVKKKKTSKKSKKAEKVEVEVKVDKVKEDKCKDKIYYFDKRINKFCVIQIINKRMSFLGSFNTEEEAKKLC